MTDTPDMKGGNNAHAVAASELRSFIDRIERLEDEKSEIAETIKDVKNEAKSKGFDKTTLNEMLRLRKLDPEKRAERENLRDLYGTVLGIFG